MPSENEIFFENAVEKLFSLSKSINAMTSDLNELQAQISRLAREIHDFTKSPLYVKKNAFIVRVINKHLRDGASLQESLVRTSEELNEPLKRCQAVFMVEKNQQKQNDKFALLHTIKTLEKARFPKARIAKITGYSEKYIYELKKRENERQKAS